MRFDKIVITGAYRKTARNIRRCLRTALKYEDPPFRAHVNVTVTDNEGIQQLNCVYRNIDSATDVLSFPMLDWFDGEGELPAPYDRDANGRVELGDIVLSYERALEQARAFGHSVDRECGYLTVHSLLHLLGYDHDDGEQRRILMRRHEEIIMKKAGLPRIAEGE